MSNKGAYVEPWTRQKNLQKQYNSTDVPDIPELVQLTDDILIDGWHGHYYSLRAKALFCMYYLTACRASEIVKCHELRKSRVQKDIRFSKLGIKKVLYALDEKREPIIDRWSEKHSYEGVRKKEIAFQRVAGRKVMIVRAENRKNPMRSTKRLPIPIELEAPLVRYVIKYLKHLEPEDALFPFGNQRATQIINQTVGFNIHFIRHIRATHLITKYDFNEQSLINFMGWSDSRPAKHYMQFKSSDIVREFYKR